LAGLVTAINAAAITGVTAVVDSSNKLQLFANSNSEGDGSSVSGGSIAIDNSSSAGLLTTLGVTATEYLTPSLQQSPNFTVPRWRNSDTEPRPTGSVWNMTTPVNLGEDVVVKRYDAVIGAFIDQLTPVYGSDQAANAAFDPAGGGQNIPTNALYVQFNTDPQETASGSGVYNNTFTQKVFVRLISGATVVIGSTTTPTFTVGNTFTISASGANSSTLSNPVTATIGGTGTAADFVAAVSAANVPNVSASVNSAGAIVFTHATGGNIALINVSGTPLILAGFTTSVTGVRAGPDNGLIFSNFAGSPTFEYTASATAPDQDPDNGRLWYYSATNQVDIMIQNNGAWQGYQNVTNDVRGYNLSNTNDTGPIFATTAPTTENDPALSPLAYGDLWIDTSDLENYPVIYRWESVEGVDQWVLIDNTDQTTENGILFADARWSTTGTVDPISGAFPSITSLLTSNYLDLDAPDPALYPQGMLLFNTRRSGFNVKSFQVNYFNGTDFSIDAYSNTTTYAVNDFVLYSGTLYVCKAPTTGNLPTNANFWNVVETNSWVTASGNKNNGSPYMGRQAQRSLIVAALKSGLDSNVDVREEQRQFNLIACPQYPELIPNMVELNNDRNNTAFVIGDTPLRLAPDSSSVVAWATNNNGLGIPSDDGLSANDTYLGVFYPSCQTTDLSGSPVVQPPSHMMIRTIVRNDEVAFPWLAPAGTRRGVVDNAARIGYVNAATGEFETIGVRQGLRDVLYENDINPITFVPGVGITNFGNKTATSVTSALDRINVARLVAFVRGRLQEIAQNYLFEPNDQITRNEITNAVNSLMIDLVNKRGVYDYLVVCDLTNNTPARIDANELYVDIAIEPVKAVEFIYIPLRIKNTGEIQSGISTVATAS
jgi:hypothetical protein